MADERLVMAVPQEELAGGQSFSLSAPQVSLPKGGGAIRGIGEKFAANPVTGTGSMSVPIATSPGRSGFGPKLALSYDSGSGNGPFGIGWNLSLPSITRKTDKGLPKYLDVGQLDVFVLSGSEDLVPVLNDDGTRFEDSTSAAGFTIHRYRPRIEGLFARIERWTRIPTGATHWRSITRDNVTTVYGKDNNSRIFDPNDPNPASPTRVFSWLICESFDDKGNAVVYEYAEEDAGKVDLSQANERNRVRTANRYLKRIKYGNRVSRLVKPDLSAASWMFEVVFDYDEAHYEKVDLDPNRPQEQQHRFARVSASPGESWSARRDSFSTHRAGFEVRTYRRCRRVLMFHHIPDLPTGEKGYDGLVRSTEFDYADLDYTQPVTIEDEIAHQGSTRFSSFIRHITQSGYVLDETQPVVVRNGVPYATYLEKSLPPLEFEYSKAAIQDQVQEVDAASLENLPAGIDGSTYQWVDLHGEGITGILTEQAGAWYYKRNLSPISSRPVEFAPTQCVDRKPNLATAGGQAQFMDLAGDGQPDLVVLDGPMPGLYEHDEDEGWQPFRPFSARLNRELRNPSLRFIDLDGGGHADVLITEQDVFTWHPSLAEDGFGPAHRVRQPHDEERGPRLVFADGTQSIYLADMCGDGLTDLVRIRNGEVCYWPNMGYGRFGGKVTMDNAPRFDTPDQFDQQRIRIADIDGSGTNDIIYLHRAGARIYFNQSGNRLSEARRLDQFPRIDNIASVMTVDLLGNGTACLVWSSPLPADARRPLRYLDLMGGIKPHLLVKSANNLGAETEVHYAPSTYFYLKDKRDDRRWVTRLPFPVHVVERVVTHDRISGNRFVTRYAYHHGYFDGVEREFRGFGMVEQWDTEEFRALAADGMAPAGTNVAVSSHVPPVLTKTWFHTGAYSEVDEVSQYFAADYYGAPKRNDPNYDSAFEAFYATLLPDTVIPPDLTAEEEREACRALKGSMLRQEVYGLDGTNEAEHPYTVAEQNFSIRKLQERGRNRHAVLYVHPRESVSYHHERKPADARISHSITLEVDDYGNVLKSAAIGYGRAAGNSPLQGEDRKKQEKTLITFTENRFTKDHDTGKDPIDLANDYRTPQPSESRTYELTGVVLPGGRDRFAFDDVVDAGATARAIDYEREPTTGRIEKRLIEHVRTYYRRNDLSGSLPLGKLQSLALPFESYKLAFTPGLVAEVYGGRVTDAMLDGTGATPGGRYVHTEGDANWWIPSGRIFYSPNPGHIPALELAYARRRFFLPHRFRDPFHTNAISTESLVIYDRYRLMVEETRDALGNRVTVGERDVDPTRPLARRTQDYRVLQAALVMDPNRNRSAVAFDAFGKVVGTAVMGKPARAPAEGDSLNGFPTDLTQAQIDQFLANPKGPMAASLLADASTRVVYDLTAYWREPDPTKKPPAVAATLARETHVSDLQAGQQTKIQVSFTYSDGFGREIQKKIQAEPGPVPKRDATGKIIVDANGQPLSTPNVVSPRWVGTGWTVFNNKGKPVRQFEPYFTDTHRFEFDVKIGVSPVLFYDPVERVVATLHPNHTWEKVVFDSWRQETWDVNDTILIADPRTDADVGDFFGRLSNVDYLPTWHALRTDAAHAAAFAARYPDATDRANETRAAQKTRVHAATPTIAHADARGRTFLTIAHNKAKYSNTPATDPAVEEFYATRIILDIEGNQREIIDAKDRVVMRYDCDLLGNRIHQESMEAGERWMLNDAVGKPIRAWDSRLFLRRMTYDELRRATGLYVTENGAERLAERTVYGEGQGDAANHRGQVYQRFDGAGVVTHVAYDFKGNLREHKRELLPGYQAAPDWQQNHAATDGTFTSSSTFDALNRPLTVKSPDGSSYQATFNEANLLENIDVRLRGAGASTSFVTSIDYNAKRQREKIEYGNGASTSYEYDPLTFRLSRLKTIRPANADAIASQLFNTSSVVQDLHYSYDPIGNITRIEDLAVKIIIHAGQNVEPAGSFIYDAVYRLIEAKGREHIGQNAFDFSPPNGGYRDHPFVGQAHPNDLQALRNYTERYQYDPVGNFEAFAHRFNGAGWTRRYEYGTSLLEAGKKNNRLTRTTVGNGMDQVEAYTHDAHGNMTSMPHLAAMVWDFKDQFQQAALGGGGTAYYVYDSSGQRVRKVIESQNGVRQKERLYLGGFEIYREYNGAGISLERETLHVLDDRQRVALVETQTIQNGNAVNGPLPLRRYQLGNHLGSSSVELDRDGALIAYEEYHPYGTTSFQTGRRAAEVSLKRYRYTGKERDEESGLGYHGARYYAPWLGRWTACDPSGLTDSINLFLYVQCRPLKLVDDTGRNAAAVADFGRQLAMGGGAAAAGLLADDATVIGVVDDVLIPVAVVGAVVGLALWGGGALLRGPYPTPPTRPAPPRPAPPAAPPAPPVQPTPPIAPPAPAPPVSPPLPVPPVVPLPPVAPPVPPVLPPIAPPRPAPPVAPPRPAPPTAGPRPAPPRPAPDTPSRPETQPRPETRPRPDARPRPEDPPPPLPPDPRPPYVVRLQAQGGGLEESVVLTGLTPITVAQGVAGLEVLKDKLTRRQLEERAEPFRRAERFIRNAPAGGGVGPPGKSFALPRSDIRVDVEILRGVNFRQ